MTLPTTDSTKEDGVALIPHPWPMGILLESCSWFVCEACGISDEFLVIPIISHISLLGLIINPYLIL